MKSNRSHFFVFLAALALFSFSGNAKTTPKSPKPQILRTEIQSIQEVIPLLDKPHFCQKTLVALDVDNTLLAMNTDIGSDQWFNWQSDLIKRQQPEAVAKNMDELFAIQYKLFALVDMHPTETLWKEFLQKAQALGCHIVALTSRGSVFRTDTELELEKAGFFPFEKTIGPANGYPGSYFPQGFEKPRPVSFMNGIMMGSGQSKGLILKDLLQKTKSHFGQIILIDDTLKNIENMENDLGLPVQLKTFLYRHEDQRVAQFSKDTSRAQGEWFRAKELVLSGIIYPPR